MRTTLACYHRSQYLYNISEDKITIIDYELPLNSQIQHVLFEIQFTIFHIEYRG